ncbi:DUF2567 domain-containing protein [Amycolatopsis suaedae]|uniref:DUF2567 domain-containing protein n=2 Tax=Amycolatopsis suaedae TaxID=2510978 RepID=A0A4Q7IYB6_9PSEU|nr:DUF2567 domain-containing protein [Amycolatopsis suaedae]
MVGIPLGWLWSRLAPPQRMRVLPDLPQPVPLELESWHRFDDLVIFLLLGFGFGVVTGVVLWLLRERRGPMIMGAGVAGSVLSGLLAILLGTGMFSGWLYAVDAPPQIGDVVSVAPQIESWWVLIGQPLGVALAYGVLAAWNGRDDLGRRLG